MSQTETETTDPNLYLIRMLQARAGSLPQSSNDRTLLIAAAATIKIMPIEQYEAGFKAGMQQALVRARDVTDNFWNDQFKAHGNKGIAAFKTKLGHAIEQAIYDDIQDLSEEKKNGTTG